MAYLEVFILRNYDVSCAPYFTLARERSFWVNVISTERRRPHDKLDKFDNF